MPRILYQYTFFLVVSAHWFVLVMFGVRLSLMSVYWYPFRIPSLQVPFLSLLTAVNALTLKNEQITNQNILSTFSQP